MTIVVLDYSTASCDILQNVDADLIVEKFEDDVELYLEDIGYNLHDIYYMVTDDDPVCYINKGN